MSTNFYWTDGGLSVARDNISDKGAMRPPGDERHIGKRWGAGWWCENCSITLDVKSWMDGVETCAQCGATSVQPPQEAPPLRIVCGFTWAQDPESVVGICRKYEYEVLIVDEYDKEWRGKDFVCMLDRAVRVTNVELIGVEGWC